jgi:hypothetical protein
MTTTINASTSAGLVQTADTSGSLALQTAGTTALTINSSQVVNFANAPTVAGGAIVSAATPTALGTVYGNTSSQNAAIGQNSLKTITGDYNTSVGRDAMLGATPFTANRNDAFGYASMTSVTSGSYNSCFGFLSGLNITTGQYNVAVGPSALQSSTTASLNTAVGYQALTANTSGNPNQGFGYQAGLGLTTGGGNTLIGYKAGSNLVTGNYCTMVGNDSSAAGSSDSSEIIVGNNTTGKGSNTAFVNPNGGGLYAGNNSSSLSTTSDRRLKKNIVDNTEGLDKIAQIRVRNFEYRLPEEVTELETHCAIPKIGVQLGVIAQELREVLPDCTKEESTGVISVNSDDIFWHMVNAIKDLKALNDSLTARIVALEGQ